MAKKQTEEDKFNDLIYRMHNCGDLEILKRFIQAERDGCRHAGYEDGIISNSLLAASLNGQAMSYDYILTCISNALDN